MEFQAVIMCGPGRTLTPLASTHSDQLPKALLPIANEPMVNHVLSWCYAGNIRDVILLADESSYDRIKDYIDLSLGPKSKGKVKFKSIQVASSGVYSTAEAVENLVKVGQLNRDFIVLPCDLLTNIPANEIIDTYRCRQLNQMGIGVYYKNKFENIDKKSLLFPITLHSPLDRSDHPSLLDVIVPDREEEARPLKVRMSMLWSCAYVVASMNLLEGFIYVLSAECLTMFSPETNIIDHLKDDNVHHEENMADSEGERTPVGDQQQLQPEEGEKSKFRNKSFTSAIARFAINSWRRSSKSHLYKGIQIYVLPQEYDIVRAETVSAYMEANRWLMKLRAAVGVQQQQQQQQLPSHQASATKPATIGADSLVGQNVIIGPRTSIKRTVIGDDCKLGSKCRLNGCVIMENVTIEDGVQLENCIIGKGAVIRTKCRLISCTVEGKYEILADTQMKNEILFSFASDYSTMSSSEQEEEDEDDEDEEEDEDEDEDEESYEGNFTDGSLDGGDDLFER